MAATAHRARKRFSQNFLHDRGVLDRIVDSIDPQPGERIVEIGPGLGALTERLVERTSLLAIEIDRDLAARLRARFDARLTLVEGDALAFDWAAFASADARALKIVGNLPYHISTPLLFALLPIAARVSTQHFLLQKEVVDRMVAAPGTAAYGRLSVMLQLRYRMQRRLVVPPGAFTPAPKVQSALVRMEPLAADELAGVDGARFAQVVAAAFGQRRKTLRNALAGVLAEDRIRAAGIDPGARAETLGVAQFIALTHALAHP